MKSPRTAVILNRRASCSEDELGAALHATGIAASVHCIRHDVNVAIWLPDLARSCDLLLAAGGDGTVSTVAGTVAHMGKVLGVIPLGTLNHFARDAGIRSDLREVLAAGYTRRLHLGTINGRTFINNISVGAYPQMVVH
jgi:diacylglycerol kinase family enzyme